MDLSIRKAADFVGFVTLAMLIGCGSTKEEASRDTKGADTATARQFVQKIAARYRQAGGYTDNAFVRLSYDRGGQSFEDIAPLSVRYEAPGRIAVEAYALRMACDGNNLRAFVADRETNNFDGQCLEMPTAGQLSLAELYRDSVVAQFAGSGLAGPPPQLELLLERTPLKAWLQDPAKVSFGEPAELEGFQCQRVIVDAGPLQYVLWVDKQQQLIRRIELPWQAISGIANDPAVSSAQLTVELKDAKFHESLASERFGLDLPPLSRSVSAIIVPPPPAPHTKIGQKVEAFSFQETSGKFKVSAEGSDRDATILLWIADHAASHQTAAALQRVFESLDAATAKNCRVLLVMAEPDATRSTGETLKSWGVGLPWVDDHGAVGRDVFDIREAPCLVLLGKNSNVEFYQSRIGEGILQSLPSMIQDLASGQTVGGQIRNRFVTVRAQYLRAIAGNTLTEGPGKRWATIAALPEELSDNF